MSKRILVIIFILLLPFGFVQAATLSVQLAGRILLQVEANGEAWYVNPADSFRYFLGRPADALTVMRELGIGITNENLKKIPVALSSETGFDTDGDGLSDNLEKSLGSNLTLVDSDHDGFSDKSEVEAGYNPSGNGGIQTDTDFSKKQNGKIFLQVESHGEAWYVNPVNSRRYFLGRPDDALALMRSLGLGISNENLELILANSASYSASDLELKMFEAVNKERISYNKKALVWNSELAAVAREHSQNLAEENEPFVQEAMTCDYPTIHHEGLVFGNYVPDRLKNRGVYYFSMSGENIALMSAVSTTFSISISDGKEALVNSCEKRREDMDVALETRLDQADLVEAKIIVIEDDVKLRIEKFSQEQVITIKEQRWHSSEEMVSDTVQGWMNSPGHRASILEEEFDESGMGIANVGGYLISTQVFIKRIDCGYKDAECCNNNKYSGSCYLPLSCEESVCK